MGYSPPGKARCDVAGVEGIAGARRINGLHVNRRLLMDRAPLTHRRRTLGTFGCDDDGGAGGSKLVHRPGQVGHLSRREDDACGRNEFVDERKSLVEPRRFFGVQERIGGALASKSQSVKGECRFASVREERP